MNTITELRRSLEETAHAHQAPDPHELLRGVQDDIAIGRGMPSKRPRIVAAAAAVALVAAGGWALTQGLDEEDSHTLQPADEAWELVDGAPPEYAAGLALVDTVTLSADAAEGILSGSGTGNRYVVAWCDPIPPPGSGPSATLTAGGGESASALCGDPAGGLPHSPSTVPRPEDGQDLTAEVLDAEDGGIGPLNDGETVTLGLYREASVSEFPYPDQAEVPDPPSHDVVIDASSPLTNQAELADLTGQGVMLPAATVESHEGTRLTAWAGEPGRLLVAVNGTVITNDGEDLSQPSSEGAWQPTDPDLRGGYWHAWTAGAQRWSVDLSPFALKLHGIDVAEGDQVTVVASGAFPRDAWQVGIDQPEGVAESADPGPVEPNEVLPEFAYGFEQVTAVSVPADGAAHSVEVGDEDPTELVWVAQCPEGMQLAQVQVGQSTTQCHAGIEWFLAVQDDGLSSGEPVEVTVAPGAEPVTVAAYAPRVWEDYPFEESTDPMAASDSVLAPAPVNGEAPPEMAETRGTKAVYREVSAVGTDDLDADGRAEITVPSSTDLSIWLETTGVARVKLEVDGTPIEQLLPTPQQPVMPGTLQAHQLLVRDGWFSTWSGEPSGHELRLDGADAQTGQAERDNPTVTIQVEAQDAAEVDLTFYEFVPEDEFDD